MRGLNREGKESRAERRCVSPAVGFGSSFAGGMAVFAVGGHWLDGKFGHESLFTLIGIGLGLLYGAWELWKLVTISNQQTRARQAEKEERSAHEPPR